MKTPIKKKDFTTPLGRLRRIFNQIMDYQVEHDCYITIVKDDNDDSLLNVAEISIKKEDLEHPLVQEFLKILSEQLPKKEND